MAEVRAFSEAEGIRAQHAAVLAVAVGERLGMTDAELLDLRYAASLHNLGKVDLPVGGRYAFTGAVRLSKIPFLQAASAIVSAHRERFDGSGTPHGWSGEAIPLGARILATVIAHEEDALNIEGAFDPKTVEALRSVNRVVQFMPRSGLT